MTGPVYDDVDCSDGTAEIGPCGGLGVGIGSGFGAAGGAPRSLSVITVTIASVCAGEEFVDTDIGMASKPEPVTASSPCDVVDSLREGETEDEEDEDEEEEEEEEEEDEEDDDEEVVVAAASKMPNNVEEEEGEANAA